MNRILRLLSLVYIAAIPLDQVTVFGGRSVSAFIGALLAIVGMCYVVVGKRNERSLSLPSLAPICVGLALVVISLLSSTWSLSSSASLANAQSLFGLTLTTWALGLGLSGAGNLPLRIYSMVGAVLGLWVIRSLRSQLVWAVPDSGLRGTSLDLNPNQLALLLAVSAAFAFLLSLRSSGFVRLIDISCTLLAMIGVLATGSQTGLVALVLLVIALPFLLFDVRQPRSVGTQRFLVALLLLAVLAGVLWGLRDLFPERLGQTVANLQVGEFSQRQIIWQTALNASISWLPWGVGSGASGDFMAGLLLVPTDLHNTLLSMGVELGLIGLLLAACMPLSVVLAGRRSPYRTPVLAALVPIMVFSATTTLTGSSIIWLVAALSSVRVGTAPCSTSKSPSLAPSGSVMSSTGGRRRTPARVDLGHAESA